MTTLIAVWYLVILRPYGGVAVIPQLDYAHCIENRDAIMDRHSFTGAECVLGAR
jgi:hypothetical protein